MYIVVLLYAYQRGEISTLSLPVNLLHPNYLNNICRIIGLSVVWCLVPEHPTADEQFVLTFHHLLKRNCKWVLDVWCSV